MLFLVLVLVLVLVVVVVVVVVVAVFWRWQRSNMFLRRESLGSIPHPRFQAPPGL